MNARRTSWNAPVLGRGRLDLDAHGEIVFDPGCDGGHELRMKRLAVLSFRWSGRRMTGLYL